VPRRAAGDKKPKSTKPSRRAGDPQEARAAPTPPLAVTAPTPADRSLAFLSRLATEFTAVLSLPDLLEHVMRVLREETGFDSCSLALVDEHNPDVLIIRAASGIRENFRGLAVPRDQGLHGAVMQAGEPLLIPDMHADPRVYRREERIKSGIYAPLSVRRRQIGVLSAHREQVGAFTEADLNLLTVVARYLTGAIEVARLHEQLKELAATDALTGLANRRCFLDRFIAEIARSRRTGRHVSVVLLDMDGFKAINDAYGHAKGDEVLIRVAEALARGVRTSDLAARFGGDEFILMFPETTIAQAEEVLARVRTLDIPVPDQASQTARLSFSWGTAAFPDDGQDPERLLQVADSRLYAMKQTLYGRGVQPPPES
jgi:diguanylate cyclase (GGDEF)-like protein